MSQTSPISPASGPWLIVGLGNPGSEYAETRHNVGFHLIQRLSERWQIDGKQENKFKAMVGKGQYLDTSTYPAGRLPVILAQPLTYMNLSGEAVGKLMHFYKVSPERLLVIYDDAALPLGKLRLRGQGSAGGQNGMKSIIQHLRGNQEFARLRIGIGHPGDRRAMVGHVLSKFSKDEQPILDKALDNAVGAVEALVSTDLETAMTRYNGTDTAPEVPSDPVGDLPPNS
ncbi:MAG: aminoacyl-tRNA hydrolase [Vampirovibrio sp.]|nr:aminoacyl-tRNA hydrolase [Vampirovibrio sp.]